MTAESNKIEPRTTTSRQTRVLLVEDDPLIGYTAMSDLVDEGFDVMLCSNGDDGLDVALAQQFDLLITDFMMPGMNGLELIAALRDRGVTTPIILVTAIAPSALPKPDHGGFDRLLKKPYRAAEIRSVARHLVDDRYSKSAGPTRPRAEVDI